MKKMNGCALAVAVLLGLPCCKTDTPPPKPVEAPAKQEEAFTDVQSDMDPSAKESAENFLQALKRMDSPEGKKTLAETRWRQTMKFPEYREIATLSEEMFSTDVPGVRGYRRVAKLAIPREGARPFVKRYMLIAYQDAKTKTWKVFDFTEAVDAEREAERACEAKTLAGDEETTPQGCLMHCSYWLVMAGKIEQAEKRAKQANELYAKTPDPDDEARYYKARADDTIEMISRMTGERT